jgi:hypothetical protein
MCVCSGQIFYAAKKDAEGRGWQQRSLVENELRTSSKGRETHKLPVRLSKSNESHHPRQDSHSDNSHDRKWNFCESHGVAPKNRFVEAIVSFAIFAEE